MSKKLRHLDLCSGAGIGFPLAALILGQEGLIPECQLVGLCEIDTWLQTLLAQRYPGIPIHKDIWQLPHDLNIDLLTASPPCQPFSVQGKRFAADDPRDCFGALIQAIRQLRPQCFAFENVPGLLSCKLRPGNNRLYFDWLLHEIHQSGYDLQWLCISSAHFGAPWRRERLLAIGFPRGTERPKTRAWADEIGSQIEAIGATAARRGLQPTMVGGAVRSAVGLDIPIGVPSGCGVNRLRRAALGNGLDWRVAGVALMRGAQNLPKPQGES